MIVGTAFTRGSHVGELTNRAGCVQLGELGTLLEDDYSGIPFKVQVL